METGNTFVEFNGCIDKSFPFLGILILKAIIFTYEIHYRKKEVLTFNFLNGE